MRSARHALLAASTMALMGTGASVVSTPAVQRTADVASATQPGNPILAAQQAPVAPHDRRQWLRSRRTPSRYRSLRKSTGTHKQNRRRQLAGNL